jgi:hypothetical protein
MDISVLVPAAQKITSVRHREKHFSLKFSSGTSVACGFVALRQGGGAA